MKVNKSKVEVALARKKMSIKEFCESYGYSRTRFYNVVNSENVTPKVVGVFADALGVDVTEIVEME